MSAENEDAPAAEEGGATALMSARSVVVELDRRQQLALSDYGAPPVGWLDALPYAVHVLGRRRALRRDLAALRRRVVATETQVVQTLAALGARLLEEPERVEDDRDFLRLQERAEAAGGKVTAQEDARDAVSDAADDARAALLSARDAARAAARPLRAAESELRASLEDAKQQVKRQRQQVESARKLLLDGEDEATRSTRAASLAAAEAALDASVAERDAKERALAERAAELAAALDGIDAAEAPLAELDADAPVAVKRLASVVETLSEERRLAFAELGRFGLELRDPPLTESWAEARAADVAVRAGGQLAKEVALHEAALADADEAGVARGVRVLLGLAGIVALALAVALVRAV